MNQRSADALMRAALDGVRQIVGNYTDGRGGYCAMGVIQRNAGFVHDESLSRYARVCPECGPFKIPFHTERDLIIHLNDHHHWDFLTIARKLGPSSGLEDEA
jgi:hypothetical protein